MTRISILIHTFKVALCSTCNSLLQCRTSKMFINKTGKFFQNIKKREDTRFNDCVTYFLSGAVLPLP